MALLIHHNDAARGFNRKLITHNASRERHPKRKDPSGGTTGRVEPYGRLGWMGARA